MVPSEAFFVRDAKLRASRSRRSSSASCSTVCIGEARDFVRWASRAWSCSRDARNPSAFIVSMTSVTACPPSSCRTTRGRGR